MRQITRSEYLLTTKAWGPVGKGPNDRGLGRKHLLSEVEKSLRAFQTDYIDIFYCHRFDPDTDLEETLRTLNDLIQSGKVLYIGFSEWTAAQITSAVLLQKSLGLHRFSASQPLYHMFDRDLERDILPLCEAEGIGQVLFSVLAQGILTGKYLRDGGAPNGSRVKTQGRLFPLVLASSERNRFSRTLANEYKNEPYVTIVERLSQIAHDAGVTLSQLAIAWTLRLPQVSSAVVGVTSTSQLLENIEAADIVLDEEILKRISDTLSGNETR